MVQGDRLAGVITRRNGRSAAGGRSQSGGSRAGNIPRIRNKQNRRFDWEWINPDTHTIHQRHLPAGQTTIISDTEYESVTWPPDSIEILEAPGVSKTICLQNTGYQELQWSPDRSDPYSPERTLRPGETLEILVDEWRRLSGAHRT
jgi:hypothetical protein